VRSAPGAWRSDGSRRDSTPPGPSGFPGPLGGRAPQPHPLGAALFTHIVLFQLLDPATDAERVRDGLLRLRDRIPQIRDLEVGIDAVRAARSYDVSLIVRFDSRADHDAYQVHPAHQDFVAFLNPLRRASIAVDYED
jgi:hypothetical protein